MFVFPGRNTQPDSVTTEGGRIEKMAYGTTSWTTTGVSLLTKGTYPRVSLLPNGALFVDAGARKALRDGGKSLLPPGVARCAGEFAAGDVVRICDLDGTEFARGIAKFGGDEVRARKLARVEIVHRDDLVIL